MQPEDYKSRTRNVRRDARAHLIALRRARKAERSRQAPAMDTHLPEDPVDAGADDTAIAFVRHTDTDTIPNQPDSDPEPATVIADPASHDPAIADTALAEFSEERAFSASISAPAQEMDTETPDIDIDDDSIPDDTSTLVTEPLPDEDPLIADQEVAPDAESSAAAAGNEPAAEEDAQCTDIEAAQVFEDSSAEPEAQGVDDTPITDMETSHDLEDSNDTVDTFQDSPDVAAFEYGPETVPEDTAGMLANEAANEVDQPETEAAGNPAPEAPLADTPEPERMGATYEPEDVGAAPNPEDSISKDIATPDPAGTEIPLPEDPTANTEQPDLAAAAPAEVSYDPSPDSAPDPAAPLSMQEKNYGDLVKLPGAGPGLIWMLNQCDVHSLADLAVQDAVTLSERLGLVGQILDVNQWIKLAQSKTATP